MRRLGYCRKKRQSELERRRKLERCKFYNRKRAPCEGDSIEWIGWHAGYFLRQNEVDGKGKPGCLAMWNLHDAEPSHLDLASKGLRRRGDKASIAFPFDPHLIIGDEKGLEAGFRAQREKTEREVGFAAAGRPANECRAGPERHAGAMDELAGLTHACLLDSPYAAGSRITKRAPPLSRSAAPALLPLAPSPSW